MNDYSNNDHGKKVYTMEDNVKYMSFSMKALVKELEKIVSIMGQMLVRFPKKDVDTGSVPF